MKNKKLPKEDYLHEPVVPFEVDESLSARALLEKMANTSFQGRNLGRAFQVWQQMVVNQATVFLGLAGAMVPAGMRKVMVYLLQKGLIHCLVSTGANLFHDCHESLGRRHFKGSPAADDVKLREQAIDRIYDTFASDLEFQTTDRFISAFAATLPSHKSYSTREFFQLLGQHLIKEAQEEGILTAAARANVPIYCPALGDSSIGIAIAVGNEKGRIPVQFDIIADVEETANLVASASSTGVIYVGGGTPKNFIQQTEVTASLRGQKVLGHQYAIQITADAPHWGGLSGCTFSEAQSWGKISTRAQKVSVHCDATIALPLLVSAMAEWLDQRAPTPTSNSPTK
jgi:deoxyhypusine synthase